jgi:hypothetical protein
MNTLTQDPIAWIKPWYIEPTMQSEADDGFDVCNPSDDGAFPVFTKEQLDAAFALGVAQERELQLETLNVSIDAAEKTLKDVCVGIEKAVCMGAIAQMKKLQTAIRARK